MIFDAVAVGGVVAKLAARQVPERVLPLVPELPPAEVRPLVPALLVPALLVPLRLARAQSALARSVLATPPQSDRRSALTWGQVAPVPLPLPEPEPEPESAALWPQSLVR